MDNNTYDIPQPAPGRSTFLTVLCILTFIGSAWGILGGIYGYVTAEQTAIKNHATLDKMEDQMDGKEASFFVKMAVNSLSLSADDLHKSNIFNIVSSMLTVVGAIFMFSLRKNGFYIYIAGCVIGVIGPLLLFGTSFMGVFATTLSGVISTAFVIMYGVNTKYMTR